MTFFSKTVELADVEEAARLHREALKQSATDPLTGRIDVSILTTGQVSNSDICLEYALMNCMHLRQQK